MRIPLLLYLSGLSETAPLVAAALARHPARGARAWILAWSAVLFVESAIFLWLALRGIHNVWLSYLFSPVANAMVLWALSCWQVSDLARLTLRLAIIPTLAAWLVLTLAFEDTSSFSRAAEPLICLVGLLAAAATLVARSRTATGDLLQRDWFWVSAGLALYLGTFSTVGPLSAMLVGSDAVLMARAYEFQAALSVVAFLAIARGMWCAAT